MPQDLSGLAATRAARLVRGARERFDDTVAEETAIALVYNGEPHAVMMASPTDLEDFLLGFSLTEGVVATPAELTLVDRSESARGISLQALIPHGRLEALRERRRGLEGRTGCGLCGIESLEQAIRPVPRVARPKPVEASAIADALAALAARQTMNRASGGVHAAAFVSGGRLLVREDVGRHNALDKLVGALAREPRRDDGFLLVTSRASYEIVHKAAVAGIGVVVAVSAPTALAIRVAEEAGIALAAFARGESMTLYANGDVFV